MKNDTPWWRSLYFLQSRGQGGLSYSIQILHSFKPISFRSLLPNWIITSTDNIKENTVWTAALAYKQEYVPWNTQVLYGRELDGGTYLHRNY